MSTTELENTIKAWQAISHIVRVPHTEDEYAKLVDLLDFVLDEVGEDESHPLAPFLDLLGLLVEKYEERNLPNPFQSQE